MNTRTITTYRDSVPFTRFTMRVGVVHETIRSPLFRDDVVHGKVVLIVNAVGRN